MTATDADLPTSVEQCLARVEERLQQVATSTRELDLDDRANRHLTVVDAASVHLIQAGGKRVRPALTLLTAHLGDATRPEVIEAAVAVELTHLASLYHDDVMDSADTRRGAPAAHALWGNTVAILIGDMLFARASRLVAGLGAAAVRIQSETFERLCLGQLAETVGPRGGDPVAHYLQVLADKTGALISTAGRYGAIFSGCDEKTTDIMYAYGEKVGIAFQLADDVIDLSESVDQTGKNPGTDLRERVPTMPVLLARQAAARGDRDAHELVALIDGDLSDDGHLTDVVARVRDSQAALDALALARRYAADAVSLLAGLPAGEVRSALADFAQEVVDRSA